MIVTFLYRIKTSKTTDRYFGKYIGPCPVYEEGLDRSLVDILFPLFQSLYPSIQDQMDITIGVLSADREAKDYYSEEEKDIFDLLYCEWPLTPKDVFYQGRIVKEFK